MEAPFDLENKLWNDIHENKKNLSYISSDLRLFVNGEEIIGKKAIERLKDFSFYSYTIDNLEVVASDDSITQTAYNTRIIKDKDRQINNRYFISSTWYLTDDNYMLLCVMINKLS